MAKTSCTACGLENSQDSNFCRNCGASLSPVEFDMSILQSSLPQNNRISSRTASQNSLHRLHKLHGSSQSLCSPAPSIRTNPRGSLTRNSSSYALLLRLEAAGPEWRDVEGWSDAGCRSPDAHPGCGSPLSPKGRSSGVQANQFAAAAFFPEEESELAEVDDKVTVTVPSQKRWGVERDRFLMFTEVSYAPSFPRILCVSRRYLRKNKYVDITGEYHLDLIQGFGGAPIILPRTMKTLEQMMEYLPMDGLVIAEGNDLSDDILLKYGCSIPERLQGEAALKWASDTELDISKDELEFRLMRFALAAGVPIMSFCRGSQMLNCLRGGTLIGDIASQTDSTIPHLRDASEPDYDSFRHEIDVIPNTPLAEWFWEDLQDSNELLANSYHHQASKVLGSNLVAMAHSHDGLIEAFYDPSYDPKAGKFVVGLQFHPERMLEDYPGCARCYESFLEACTAYKALQDSTV